MRERDDAALVTVVFAGDPRHVRAIRASTGLRAPVLFDVPVRRSGKSGQPSDARPLKAHYGINQVPWTLVVNAQGRAVEVIMGAHGRDRFIKALDAAD